MEFPFTDEQIKALQNKIEEQIYDSGLYRKMSGSWSIKAELNDCLVDGYLDEREEGDSYVLPFKITATCYEEDEGHSDWWNINADVDKDCKLIKLNGG